ncbi:lysophospholipid acyltransferase family protein, partial [Pelagibacteraceae bacterium]|nr:lysophospholipid acyltransferase family protein [Pelagibacteraceae bacterium]
FFFIFKIIGLKNSSNLSCFIFKVIGPLLRNKNKIKSNIQIALPNIKKNKEKEIINKMWCNYGRIFAEYMHLKKLRDSNFEYIKINNANRLEELKKKNKPILFFSGHFANFELLAMIIEKKKFQVSAIYRPLNNFFLNPLMEYLRKKYLCNDQIPKSIPGKGKEGTRILIDKIKNKKNIAIMIDQKVSQGIKCKLFAKDALTTNIPAQLALKHGYLLQPLKIKRYNQINFEIDVCDTLEVNTNDNQYLITRKINQILEKMILDNPDQWIWTHDRWRI